MSVGSVAGNSNVMQVQGLMNFTSAAMKAVQSSVANGHQVSSAAGNGGQVNVTA